MSVPASCAAQPLQCEAVMLHATCLSRGYGLLSVSPARRTSYHLQHISLQAQRSLWCAGRSKPGLIHTLLVAQTGTRTSVLCCAVLCCSYTQHDRTRAAGRLLSTPARRLTLLLAVYACSVDHCIRVWLATSIHPPTPHARLLLSHDAARVRHKGAVGWTSRRCAWQPILAAGQHTPHTAHTAQRKPTLRAYTQRHVVPPRCVHTRFKLPHDPSSTLRHTRPLRSLSIPPRPHTPLLHT